MKAKRSTANIMELVKTGILLLLLIGFGLLIYTQFFTKQPAPKKGGAKVNGEKTRQPVVAGMFYPGNAGELKTMIDGFLDKATKEEIPGELVGLVVPHAGYIYSGQVAAYSYKELEGRSYDTVVVAGPTHYVGFQGASVSEAEAWQTPLGQTKIDVGSAKELAGGDGSIRFYAPAHLKEHSVEVQLPFLQIVTKDAQFLPIVVGQMDNASREELANGLAKLAAKKKVMLIASSDLSHYYPYDTAEKMDKEAVNGILGLDADYLLDKMDEGACELCGSEPVSVIMMAAKKLGANKAKLLHYANSGDVTGDKSGVVGYAAIAIYKKQ